MDLNSLWNQSGQSTGYGGQTSLSGSGAGSSFFPNTGSYTDYDTGYTGTAQEIANRYAAEHRDLNKLHRNLGLS